MDRKRSERTFGDLYPAPPPEIGPRDPLCEWPGAPAHPWDEDLPEVVLIFLLLGSAIPPLPPIENDSGAAREAASVRH
jgi:hypothetical protein